MLATDPPPVVVTVPVDKPAEVVVVSRDTRSDVLASRDTPLPLIKGRKTEDALLRQTIFLTGALTTVRPAAGPGEAVLRWTYQPYLQRQLCFTSLTGQFGCAVAELEELIQKAAGEAPLTARPSQDTAVQAAPIEVTPEQATAIQAKAAQATPDTNPAAEAVRIAVVTALRNRAAVLFDDDRRLKLNPMLKAAGVSNSKPSVSAVSARRRRTPQQPPLTAWITRVNF